MNTKLRSLQDLAIHFNKLNTGATHHSTVMSEKIKWFIHGYYGVWRRREKSDGEPLRESIKKWRYTELKKGVSDE